MFGFEDDARTRLIRAGRCRMLLPVLDVGGELVSVDSGAVAQAVFRFAWVLSGTAAAALEPLWFRELCGWRAAAVVPLSAAAQRVGPAVPRPGVEAIALASAITKVSAAMSSATSRPSRPAI